LAPAFGTRYKHSDILKTFAPVAVLSFIQ